MDTSAHKRILITGASGLLGANLLYLFPKQWSLTGLVHNHLLRSSAPEIVFLPVDITQPDFLRWLRQQGAFDVIMHCAALTSVEACEQDQAQADRLHVEATRQLAQFSAEQNAHFIYISTDHIFGGGEGNYAEDALPEPRNYYAQSKLKGEQAVLAGGGHSTIIRTNFFGFNFQPKHDIAGWMMEALNKRQPRTLFTDVFFSPILVNFLAEAISAVIEKGIYGIINIAGSDGCSKYDFGIKLTKAFNLDNSVFAPGLVDEAEQLVARPKNMTLNTSRASQVLEYTLPTVDVSIARYKALADQGYQASLREAFSAG